MKNKPEITDEEIQATMNFDNVLKKYQQLKAKSHNGSWRYVLLGGAAIVICTIAWLTFQNGAETAKLPPVNSRASDSIQQKEIEGPVVQKDPDSASADLHKKTETGPVRSSKRQDKKPRVPDEKSVSAAVYVIAEPVNGYPALYEYFSRELVYPKEAMKDSIEGVVTVVFQINTLGKPEKIQVENSLAPLLDKEAVRVVENMPLWKPATYNNKPVASKLSLPLSFKIERNKN